MEEEESVKLKLNSELGRFRLREASVKVVLGSESAVQL